VDSRNQHQISFRQYEYHPEFKSFWVGTKINFSGENATYFYSFIKKHPFDWNVFDLQKTSLGRFDLCYFRKTKVNEQIDQLEIFLNNCRSKITSKYKNNNVNYDRNIKGYILRIGNRKSSNFYRIYQTKNGLRFELEIKNRRIQQVSKILVRNAIEEFEEQLTEHFYMYSKKVLAFHDYYTDWLVDYFRKTDKPTDSLVTSYLQKQVRNSFSEQVTFFTLLQFLAFTRHKKYDSIEIYNQSYFLMQFSLKEFMKFAGVKNINQYQRNKFIGLFYSFQKMEPLINKFSDTHFQSLVSFPYLDVQKKDNYWIVKLAVVKQFYHYFYPFSFSNTFLTYKTIYDLQIKLQIIEVISTNSLEKVFYIEVFLNQFHVSKQKKTQIKTSIIILLNKLQMSGLIKKHYKLIKKSRKILQVDKLTNLLLGQTNIIYLYENI
jgi:hypothetical protein